MPKPNTGGLIRFDGFHVKPGRPGRHGESDYNVNMIRTLGVTLIFLLLLAGMVPPGRCQGPGDPPEMPVPPLPSPSDLEPEDDEEEQETTGRSELLSLLPESDKPWGLTDDLTATLAEKADLYRVYTRQFTCMETARSADYVEGEAGEEKLRRYSFLLTTDPLGANFRESRRKIANDGDIKKGESKDEEPFPPAYAWVFLFSSFNQPYFSYRYLGDRFDGFDWVREIEFKGALPFTDGKDIRQWEGIVMVDAVSFTPLEIRAQPVAQEPRIKAKFRRWAQAFNLVGFRMAPRPFGYRCRVEFHFRKDRLSFPTRLRYDTFRAVSSSRIIPWKVSARSYSDYRFFEVGTEQKITTPR